MKHLVCQQTFAHTSRFAFFAEKPKSAPSSAEKQESIPSYEHLKKEVSRFAERIGNQFKKLEEHYKVTIDRTKFDASDEERYKKAGMSPEAVRAVKVLVLNLAAMREALKKGEAHRSETLNVIRASVAKVNALLKQTSEDALYGNQEGDPLAEFTGGKMANLGLQEEEKTKAEEKVPEVKEASPEELFQLALFAFVEGKDQPHDVKALLDMMAKRGEKHLEEKVKNVTLIIDRSTDGKSVRVQGIKKGEKTIEGEAPGLVKALFSTVAVLDSKDKGTRQFETRSYPEEFKEKLEENQKKFSQQIEDLKKAPVGSRIVINQLSATPTSARFNILRKEADGSLSVVVVEQALKDGKSVFDKDGYAVTKDLSKTPYDPKATLAFAGTDSPLVFVEADEKESQYQARKEIKKMAKTFASTLGTPPAIVESLQNELLGKIRKLALAHGIQDMDPIQATDPIGKRRYLRIAAGKIEWGEVKKKKNDSMPQYVAQRTEPLGQKPA